MSGFTGIASNASPMMSTTANPPNPNAPEGTHVAFVQGASTMATTPLPIPKGTWRLRFRAAQRSYLGINRQVLRVSLGSTEVFEGEPVGATFQVYTTRAVHFPVATTATLTVAGTNPYGGDNTAFVDQIELEPVGDWNMPTTWNLGSVPGPASNVVIPANVEVALRGPCQAATITLAGELLTTGEDATLRSRWLGVSGSGARFEVGRELTPFVGDFQLTLTGNDTIENAMGAGSKFLMAMDGGRIDMHGVQKTAWSKLTSLATSTSGGAPSSVIRVTDRSGWLPGDQVVVTYTGHVSHSAGTSSTNPYQGPRSQVRTIDSIAPNGDIKLLGTLLVAADHCTASPSQWLDGNSPTTWQLDQRAEVGNLTRNVRIVGEATPAGLPPFGGHVMLMACCPDMPPGQGRFADVEFRELGQAAVLGRYPLHWHMQRDSGYGQYARRCSIHTSHNRGITLHGTHGVQVERNVVHDVTGHAVFLEDGVETGNRCTGNLVVATRKPASCERMLPHDNSRDEPQNRTPAAFWISHPQNDFVDNVAADSLGVGYWFALHTQKTGLASTSAWASSFVGTATLAAPGLFTGNVAHSMKMGIDVHDSVLPNSNHVCLLVPPLNETPTEPFKDPRNDDVLPNTLWNPPTNAVLSGCTVFGCTTGIYTGGGIDSIGTIRFRDFVLADNGAHVHLASMDTVEQSLLVRDSGNVIFPTGANLPNGHLHPFEMGHAYVVYDGPGRVRDCHLVGWSAGSGFSAYFSLFGAARRHTDHRISGLTFAGSGLPLVGFHDFATLAATSPQDQLAHPHVFGIAVLDEDMSLTGGLPPNPANPVPHTLISNHPMMHLTDAAGATPDVALNPSSPHAWLSPFRWSHLQVRYYAGTSQNTLLEMGSVPTARFTRKAWIGWPATSIESTFLPSAQMRQLPVIVVPNGGATADCIYEVVVRDPTPQQTTLPLRRIDVSIDDFGTAQVSRLQIRHETQPNWVPTLYVNDHPTWINTNGQHPSVLPPLLSVGQGGPAHPGATTSWQQRTVGGWTLIDLRLVKPANTLRAHRISITW